ncbi:group 3 secretory phospholipase A2 [Crotalus tigris]|uniref:group 3 secretory phospholipase A2 n=1 Tax=Crotalus tigris TaxID=88082 RepID=UPI00192F689C|nr:group 3 secretory phospholipase A2 [Crotalus tigris]
MALPARLALLALGLALPCARGAWTEANTACATRATGGRSRLLSFLWLRPDGAPPVLVQSLWDRRGGQLLECAWRAEPALTRRYLELCAPGRLRGPLVRASWGPRLRKELAALEARKGGCKGAPAAASREPAGEREAQARPRSRRGLTLPGTLWCGAGHSAKTPSELGVFQGPDVCCREHDTCDAHISPLGFKYGIRNYHLHTISHCSCDNRFRDCLKNLNDTISNFIGTSFFNLLEIPCFYLKESEDCLEWHWWGGCKKYGLMLLAQLVEPNPYQPIENPDGTTSPPQPRRHRKPSLKDRKGRRKQAKKMKKLNPTTQGPITPLSPISKPNHATHILGTSSPGETMLGSPARKTTPEPGPWKTDGGILTTHHPVVLPVEESFSNKTWQGEKRAFAGQASKPRPALSRRCRCYQRLDQCPFQIGPNEFKYQLHNSDGRTLFHCNCTRRLARFLRRTKVPNEVEEQVLSNYISPSCFVLENFPGCREGDESWPNCIGAGNAILAPARHLTNWLVGKRPRASFKVKRQGGDHLEEGAPQLFDKCVQLVRAALQPAPH